MDTNEPAEFTTQPDLSQELSRELHPSKGLSNEAISHIIRLARRDEIINRLSQRARSGGRYTDYTKRIIEERKHQREHPEA